MGLLIPRLDRLKRAHAMGPCSQTRSCRTDGSLTKLMSGELLAPRTKRAEEPAVGLIASQPRMCAVLAWGPCQMVQICLFYVTGTIHRFGVGRCYIA